MNKINKGNGRSFSSCCLSRDAQRSVSSPIAEAASVLLARSVGSHEVFLVRRADNLRFFGGFHAFPGGKVDVADRAAAERFPGLTAIHFSAIRELFEETGVLLARTAKGDQIRASEEVVHFRRELLAGRSAFADFLQRNDLVLMAEDLTAVGSLVTPPFSPMRFDTRFFTAILPAGQEPAIWPGELAGGEWLTAPAALASWGRGQRLLSPPTVTLLQAFDGRPVNELFDGLKPVLDQLAAGELPPISFAPDVDMLPLRCDGLPPSTHTNAFLIGRDPAFIIDPAPTDPAEQQRLFVALDRHQAAGRRLAVVVLSHHHPDHIGAAQVCEDRYGVPIYSSHETAKRVAGKVRVARELEDGDRLELGRTPTGEPWFLDVMVTPGHAPGHLVFYDTYYRFLYAGDMVSTLSSVVIAPPEGDLGQYLDSLCRLQNLPARLLLPSHGGPTARVAQTLKDCLEHRRQRQDQLLSVLNEIPQSVAELASALYKGLPNSLARFAELQTLAGLQKLQNEGRAIADGTSWRRGI